MKFLLYNGNSYINGFNKEEGFTLSSKEGAKQWTEKALSRFLWQREGELETDVEYEGWTLEVQVVGQNYYKDVLRRIEKINKVA